MKQPAQPTQTIAWIAEEQLELWEISSFHERSAVEKIEKTDKQEKTKKHFVKSSTSATVRICSGFDIHLRHKL